MSDTSTNKFTASGDNAARAAFTPNPGTPTPTPAQGYTFWDTDDQTLYAYDFGMAAWVAVGGAGSGTIGGSTGAADEAVIVADGTGGATIQATPLLVNSSTGLVTFPDDVRQVFNPGTNVAGINAGAVAADPGTPVNGDVWYQSSANELRARINGATVALSAGAGITTLTSEVTAGPGSGSVAATINPAGTPQVARLGIGTAADSTALLKVAGQVWIPLVDDGNSGTALTIDFNDGNEHFVTLDDNVTFTLSNPKDGGRYVIVLQQDGGGGNTVAWPGTVLWPGGSTPTISAGASAIDLVTLIYLATGTKYLASINQDFS